jgi:signal transduction histidine kinase/CHASE3 domain sensor protein
MVLSQQELRRIIFPSDADLAKRLKKFVSIAAAFSMVLGLSGLSGWALNLPAFVTWGDGTAMAPNAAACFLLAGLSLFLLREKDRGPVTQVRKLTAHASAALVGLAGLFTLAEQTFGLDLRIDRLLLVRSPGPAIANARMIMSPITAGAFLLLSLALLVMDWRTRGGKWPAQFICLAAAFVPVLGVLGWILGPGEPPITLAWPAVVAFAMLTAALLCSRASWALGGVLTRQSPGARMLRGAFPAVLLVLCALGWLLSKPLVSGVHFTWAEVTVLAVVTASMIAGFVGWTTFMIDRSDRERRRLEEALQLRQEHHEHRDRFVNAVEEPDTEVRLRRLVKAGVAGAVLLTGLLGLLSWRMAVQAAQDAEWVAHAHEVSATLELTLRHLVDVETGERGFALTGYEPFLDPYNLGKYAVGLDLQALRTLVVESHQVRRLDVLAKQSEIKIEEAAGLVAARRHSGKTPSIARLVQGKQAMDAVRRNVQEMEDQEKLLLEQRIQRARGTWRFTSSAVGLGSILGIIFLSIAGLTVSREIRVAAKAQTEVKVLNADLERRVEQRTAALEAEVAARKQAEVRFEAQVSEVAHSRQALETQKLMLHSVLNSMVEGLVATDEQGNFILWNQAAKEILGLGPADQSPTDWSADYGTFLPDMITPFPNAQNPLFLAIAGEVSSAVMFIRNPGLDRGAWIESNGAPLRDQEGAVRGGVLAFRDITQRKADELEIRKLNDELEERIAKRTQQLEATNDELEAFSYSVSHDLRTPLRHISGFARILVNDFGPAMAGEAREHLQRIEDAVRRMGLLVDALLRMAVLRRRPLRLSHSELNPIVDEVVTMLHGECDGRDVEWRIAKLPALDCDPILMAQVFQNLLGNALKYSRGRAKAVIEVDSIQQPDKPAIIFVRDNGAGFNLEYAEKLFGVFQRFHTDSEFEGSGVGLATVHRIIQKHGGMIWAEAEPDQGATFYFALQTTEQIVTTPKATAVS